MARKWRAAQPTELMEQIARRHREIGICPKDDANYIKFPMPHDPGPFIDGAEAIPHDLGPIDTVTVSVFYLGHEGVELPCFRYEYKGDVFALQIDTMVFLRRMEKENSGSNPLAKEGKE